MPASQTPSVSLMQLVIVIAFGIAVAGIAQWVYSSAHKQVAAFDQAAATQAAAPIDPAEAERCKVPDFAKAMGHEEMWKLHNHCR